MRHAHEPKPTACAIMLLCSAGCSHGSGGDPPPWLSPTAPGTSGVDINPSTLQANESRLVPFAVVDHSILLASDRGIPGAETAHLQLLAAGAALAGILRVLDDAFRKVAELPFADGALKLPPEVFPVQGSLYYLQAVSAGEATCRLQPVWVPVPDVDPAIDFGRGGFVLTGGEPKEIRFGDEGYTGTVSLGLPDQNVDTSVAIDGHRSVTIVPPIRGDEDLVYELRVQIETPAGSHNDIRAVVAVRAVR